MLAEQITDLPDDQRSATWQRSHRDYSAEVEMLTALFDRVGELVRLTAALHGAKPGPPSPAPRPVYAIERARKARARQQHYQLVSRLIKKSDTTAE